MAGKGDGKRPCLISEEESKAAWERVFGPPKLKSIMSDAERLEMEAEKARLIAESEKEECGQ